ncbi:TIGR00730 family Rossman fold protein [Acetobacter sp. AN02]|uniref:LOG family protein n=1 Tax=Acetobacter sp. AN02 TaxID=2894186 RepID=UPI0024341C78|nr:TIGR00730 family Rossman fold protein [Acetobacter sp. AN02]MDG6094243.1 TIGR00730 family Rossman fold protein [Acetobacter sp. AN02]
MKDTLSAVAVFCGSRFGNNPGYEQAAREIGAGLARAGLRLVYGGGDVGLMGATADAAIEAGGQVTGVIPSFLEAREIMHQGVAELIITEDMHERKTIMFGRADAFLILPGGFGTFDELMEITTWKQLQLHTKPVIIVNVLNWADSVLMMLDAAVAQGFASADARALIETVPDTAAALRRLAASGVMANC